MAQNLFNEILAERTIIESEFLPTAKEKFPDANVSSVTFDEIFTDSGRVFHHFWYGPYEFEGRVTGSNNDRAWINRIL